MKLKSIIDTDLGICGNYFTSTHPQINTNRELFKKQILPFLKRAFRDLATIDSITISKNKITYRQENQDKELKSIVADIFRRRIFRTTSLDTFTLTHDAVGETIHTVAESLHMPKLYTDSSGGGGHKAAKNAIIDKDIANLLSKIQKVVPTADDRLTSTEKLKNWCREAGLIQEKDLFHDYLGPLGKWSSNQWDNAQKAGNIRKLEFLFSIKWFSELILGPLIFLMTLHNLRTMKPKELVCTTAVCIPGMLLAVAVYNILFKPKGEKDLHLNLYMTDMPTRYASHFFKAIRSLWESGGKKNLILHSPRPKNDDTWEILCKLPDNQIHILETNELPVRPAFLKAVTDYHKKTGHSAVKIKISCEEEKKHLKKTLEAQKASTDFIDQIDNKVVQHPINPEDKNVFLMLGSQPTEQAVKDYVDRFMALAIASPKEKFRLFAFAGKYEEGKECFYKTLCSYIQSKKAHWPTNLEAIPLSFQDPDQLVSLMLECDLVSRSGGITTYELLVLDQANKDAKKRRFIHADRVEGRSLENSMVQWEKGNYLFLHDTIQASLTNPQEFLI